MSTTIATPPDKPPRKFPAPCWTQEETLALIDAYRNRWYALRRGYLRTADWDAVAAVVSSRCPDASPSKTSAQCRHKMEKLRQRYRTEKQRSLSFPGRFFSSWFFFDNMDSMANGSSPAVGSDQDSGNRIDSGFGIRIKSLGDRNSIESVFGRNNSKIDGDPNPNLDVDQDGVNPGGGFRVRTSLGDRKPAILGLMAKNVSDINGNSTPNFGSKVVNGYSVYLDDGSDEDVGDYTDFGSGSRVRTPIDDKLAPSLFRPTKIGKIHENIVPKFESSRYEGDDGGRFCAKNPIDPNSLPPAPGFRPKKFDKVADGGFSVKISSDGYSSPARFRPKNSEKHDWNSYPDVDSRVLNGLPSNLEKKIGGRGVKRERGPIEEMVSSIKLLGEGFVKMEKMKMDMTREIEKMRMEMEMKRNELILESQRQIFDAFLTLLLENKEKRANTTVLPES
ncbi:hypothetical protein U1Q18_019257 [Sarracenia purpurea var. burkii]